MKTQNQNSIKNQKLIAFLMENCDNTIFVYGANEAGIHGAGAALEAHKQYGAQMGKVGLVGRSFGICTKDKNLKTLNPKEIENYICNFFKIAEQHHDRIFLVTKVGCGLAGYAVQDIAPMFKKFYRNYPHKNIILPYDFIYDRTDYYAACFYDDINRDFLNNVLGKLL